jgi:uncharacterized protein (DUF3084 family)
MLKEMSNGADDRDELIKQLLAESFGLRTKAEQLSQYVETKVAELVKTKRELSNVLNESVRKQLEEDVVRLRSGIEEATKQRNELQGQLDALLAEHEQLGVAHTQMTDQRDRLRTRMAEIEASGEYRLAQRLARWFPFIARGN